MSVGNSSFQPIVQYVSPGTDSGSVTGTVEVVGAHQQTVVPVDTGIVDPEFVCPPNCNFQSLVGQAHHNLAAASDASPAAPPGELAAVPAITVKAEIKLDKDEMQNDLKGVGAELWYDAIMGGRLARDVKNTFDGLKEALDAVRTKLADKRFTDQKDSQSRNQYFDGLATEIVQRHKNIDPDHTASKDGRNLIQLEKDRSIRLAMRGSESSDPQLYTDASERHFKSNAYWLSALVDTLFEVRKQGIEMQKSRPLGELAETALRLIHSMIEDIKATKNKPA